MQHLKQALEEQLTPRQKLAQKSVRENPEVIEIARRLSEFGLGIMMPHMHTDTADFADLPDDMVQVERNGQVTFERRTADADLGKLVEVGWIWREGGLATSAGCTGCWVCVYVNSGHTVQAGHTST